jgi:DNA-binding NtrC family response regulator
MLTPHTRTTGRQRILVVDDDAIVLAGLRATLEREGYDVEVSRSGYAAIDALSPGRFALVITDVMMPGLSGLELLERVRELAPETHVVVLSGYPRRELADDALEKGAAEFLVKPVDSERLRTTVRALLIGEGGCA